MDLLPDTRVQYRNAQMLGTILAVDLTDPIISYLVHWDDDPTAVTAADHEWFTREQLAIIHPSAIPLFN